jgi:hypothetical protein
VKGKRTVNMELLKDIPLELDVDALLDTPGMGGRNTAFEKALRSLVATVRSTARPKILYKVSYVDGRSDSQVTIDGVQFESGILSKNLRTVERVFPYVVTAGRELETITVEKGDMVRAFCLDALKERVLEEALRHFEQHIQRQFAPGTLAHMNPGSLKDWPISQQPALFSLFGDVEGFVGVRLKESHLMDPIKSVSGIYFPTEIDFKSCRLCTRHPCMKRRAPYDPELAANFRGS